VAAPAASRSIGSNKKEVVDDRLMMACAGAERQTGDAMAAGDKEEK